MYHYRLLEADRHPNANCHEAFESLAILIAVYQINYAEPQPTGLISPRPGPIKRTERGEGLGVRGKDIPCGFLRNPKVKAL